MENITSNASLSVSIAEKGWFSRRIYAIVHYAATKVFERESEIRQKVHIAKVKRNIQARQFIQADLKDTSILCSSSFVDKVCISELKRLVMLIRKRHEYIFSLQ